MITWYTLERGVGEARHKSNVWDVRELGCTATLPPTGSRPGCRALLCCKITPTASVFLSAGPGRCDCVQLLRTVPYSSLLKPGFKYASFAHACGEGSSYWRRAGKSDAKPPERREREGGRVLCKERAKRRNEWENKWITDGMWVSASRKISLWLPRQREVRVGSAPDITNYVRARAWEIIDMQKRKWVFVSICKWFNAIWF